MSINNKSSFYNILSFLNITDLKNVSNKQKIRNYFKKISFLNIQKLNEEIHFFMTNKSLADNAYKINLPRLKNDNDEDYIQLDKDLSYIENSLKVLEESKSFEYQERFYYYEKYKGQEHLLQIVNQILKLKDKKPLKSLKLYDLDLAEEEISFLKEKALKQQQDYKILSQNFIQIKEENITLKNNNDNLLKQNEIQLNENTNLFNKNLKLIEKNKMLIEKNKNNIIKNEEIINEQLDKIKEKENINLINKIEALNDKLINNKERVKSKNVKN